MAILIEKDKDGNKIYRGFLSSEQTKEADLLLGFLQDEIPVIGKALSEKYGDGVWYGTLYFGVSPNGDVTGQQVSASSLNDVAKRIKHAIKPMIYFQ